MKMFVKSKIIGATILCLVMAITLCACEGPTSSPSDPNSTSQTSSTTSIDKQTEGATINSTTTTTKKSAKKTTKANKKTTTKPITVTTTTTTQPQKTPAQLIVGSWRGNMDVTELLLDEGYPVQDTLMVSCDIEFTEGGVMYETINRDSLKTVYTDLMIELMDDLLAEDNITKEEFESVLGVPYDEYITEMVEMAMEMIPQTIISAYKFEGEDLYVRKQDDTDFENKEYFFNGENELTIVESGISVTYTRIG